MKLFFFIAILNLLIFFNIIFCQENKIISVINQFDCNSDISLEELNDVTHYLYEQLKQKNVTVKLFDNGEFDRILKTLNKKHKYNCLQLQDICDLGRYVKSDFIIKGRISRIDSLLILTINLYDILNCSKKVFSTDSINIDLKEFKLQNINKIAYCIKNKYF